MKGYVFCAYCRRHRLAEGHKLVSHPQSKTYRAMCAPCQAIRKKPRSELQRLADQEREARKANK